MLLALDILGTLAFAISGASKAMRHNLDWLGLVVLASVTGVGGGILRDVMLGETPPAAISRPIYLPVCFAGAFLCLFLRKKLRRAKNIVLIADALGLGFFTAVGAGKAASFDLGALPIILFAAITAAGGGLLRDVLVCEIPQVLKSDFYAVAALAGGLVFWILSSFKIEQTLCVLLTTTFTFALRLYAMRKRIELPKTSRKLR